ncbi:MAG: DHHA1 domain-containing protein, partial [Candidatus Thorarchaeota archaeon]
QKVSDGVVRLTFTAGKATSEIEEQNKELLKQLSNLLNVPKNQLVGSVRELIEKWKNLNKALQTGTISNQDLILTSKETYKGDIVNELITILGVKEDDVFKRIQNFYNEWNHAKDKLQYMKDLLNDDFIKVMIENSRNYKAFKLIIKDFDDISQKDLQNLGKKLHKTSDDLITILLGKTKSGILIIGMMGKKVTEKLSLNIGDLIKSVAESLGGKGGGRTDYGQAFIEKKEITINQIAKLIEEKLHS